MEVGKKHSYLGMQICLEDKVVKVDMIHYISKMLESVQGLDDCSVPANKNIFVVDEKSPALSKAERKKFHTMVAKLLFLSKHAHPEISTAYGFLCTRVTKATVEDRKKLFRLLGFLQRTKGRVLQLRPKDLELSVCINAAFASHADAKSHTGITIFFGGCLVFIALRKQKYDKAHRKRTRMLVWLSRSPSLLRLLRTHLCKSLLFFRILPL